MIYEPTPDNLESFAENLRRGGCVAFPTETVYGLGANALDGEAVARIFDAKGRPSFNPLIVHVTCLAEAQQYGVFSNTALTLAQAFWPGPLTLVVPRTSDCPVSELVSAGLPTIALRVPAHDIAHQLMRTAGCPLAAPSANKSGHLSPTRPEHVNQSLPDIPVLNGQQLTVGLESTIIGCLDDTPTLLRLGGLAREEIEAVVATPLNEIAETGDSTAKLAPGRLLRHYAPQARLRLNADTTEAGEALLAFGPPIPSHDGPMINLSPVQDVTEAAANLFSALHELDRKAEKIAVMPVPSHGLGAAINDRLERAARGHEGRS
ncbi:MAG: L-threonylcarbamoyladenylate synthase [Parvibaculales bacterium]